MSISPTSNPHKICYVFASYSSETETVTMTKVPCMEMMDQGGKSLFIPKAEGSAKQTMAVPEGMKWEEALSIAGRTFVTAQKVTLSLTEAFNIPTWEEMKPAERRGAIYKPVLTGAEKDRMQETVGAHNVVPMKLAVNG